MAAPEAEPQPHAVAVAAAGVEASVPCCRRQPRQPKAPRQGLPVSTGHPIPGGVGGGWYGEVATARGAVRGKPPGSPGSDGVTSRRRGLDAVARPGGGGWMRRAGAGVGGGTLSEPYSRSRQNLARQLWHHSYESASTTPCRPICQSCVTVGVRGF